MAMRCKSIGWRASLCRSMEVTRRSVLPGLRYFSDDKGRVFSEEERAAETIYIQKMERERMEKLKLKQKAEKEKAEKEKSEKKDGEAHKI